nr:MAG TPA: excisionase [Caudoviricetes sp.]
MEYLSVKDFAKLAGVTKQAVYQRLNSDLSSFVNNGIFER